jgi:hypothetical protein
VRQPRRNEARFYRYPMHRVVAVFDDPVQVDAALHDLEAASIDVSAVNVLSGREGARLLDRTGVGHGMRGRLLRFFQRAAFENEALAAHEQALTEGRHVVYVPVKGTDERQRVVNILRRHGGYQILHFRRWAVEAMRG